MLIVYGGLVNVLTRTLLKFLLSASCAPMSNMQHMTGIQIVGTSHHGVFVNISNALLSKRRSGRSTGLCTHSVYLGPSWPIWDTIPLDQSSRCWKMNDTPRSESTFLTLPCKFMLGKLSFYNVTDSYAHTYVPPCSHRCSQEYRLRSIPNRFDRWTYYCYCYYYYYRY